MLSDEEKKAIESLIEIREFANLSSYKDTKISQLNAIDVVLNLIEKQYKEIEELKNITKSYDSFLGDEKIVIADKKFFVNGYFQENFVRKDKIKAKIEKIIQILEAKPYTAYTLYGDILHESDEIAQMLKEILEKE